MFREIKEIKKEEKNLNRNFTKIKPESEISVEEANKIVLEMFRLAREES